MSPARILRAAREDAIRRNRPGFWSNGRVFVTATRYDGPWAYDVGTTAKRYAYGKPAAVLSTLASLLQEFPA